MEHAGIRDATIDDAERVAQLMTELGYPTTVEAMTDRLGAIVADPNYATFVADAGACVVGVAGATLGKYYENDGVYCQLLVLSVSSTARGQGTGTRLVETVERWAASQGARAIVVNSALHRGDAHGFYERRQYARTGYRFVKQLNDAGLSHGRPE
jgi:GNAT superfamily N-acetyltransferase